MPTPDWNTDDDVHETTTPAPVTAAPATPDVHPDPTIPSLVKPNPVAMQRPALQRNQPTVYVLTQADLDALPNDLPAVFKEMRLRNPAFRGVVPTPKSMAEFHELRRRWGRLQDSRHLPTDDELVEARRKAGVAIIGAESARQSLISESKTALEDNRFMPVINELKPGLDDVLLAFISESAVIEKIVEIRRALTVYQIEHAANFMFHSPHARAREQKLALHSNPSEDAVNRIVDEMTLMGLRDARFSQHFQLLANYKCSQLNALWNDTVKPLLIDLLQACELYVSERKLDLLQHAREFLQAHGADDAQAVAFSKKYDATLSEVKHRLNFLVNPGGGIARPVIGIHVPPVECALQLTFGIPLFPKAE